MKTLELAIIGAGPAGITAAIYAKRAGLDFAIYDFDPIGGLITNTTDLENYPGFPEPQTGTDLMMKFQEQLKNLGQVIENKRIVSIKRVGKLFNLSVGDDTVIAKTVIIATGSKTRPLGIDDEEKYVGRGISYCATCDGPLFRGRRIAIVGTGNSGIQEGLFLLKFVEHITFVEMLPHMIAEDILQKRISKFDNVDFRLGHKITGLSGEPFLQKMEVENLETGDKEWIDVDGIFVFIGYDPHTKFIEGLVEMDKKGFIKADDRNLSTNVPGLFAAGDVRDKLLRQVTTAVGDGAQAVHSVQMYLENLE